MFCTVYIDDEKTKLSFGYSALALSEKSHLKIFVKCSGCHHSICRERRNANKVHQCPVLNGQNKRCFKCKEWKDLSLFNKAPKQTGGVAKLCRKCYNEHPSVKKCERSRRFRNKKAFENNLDLFIRLRAGQLKHRCLKNKIEHNIDAVFLKQLWDAQNGKCFYTGLLMGHTFSQNGFQSWDAPSLDRKEPAKGYVIGNIVWCVSAINSFKGTLNDNQFAEVVSKIQWWFSG